MHHHHQQVRVYLSARCAPAAGARIRRARVRQATVIERHHRVAVGVIIVVVERDAVTRRVGGARVARRADALDVRIGADRATRLSRHAAVATGVQ